MVQMGGSVKVSCKIRIRQIDYRDESLEKQVRRKAKYKNQRTRRVAGFEAYCIFRFVDSDRIDPNLGRDLRQVDEQINKLHPDGKQTRNNGFKKTDGSTLSGAYSLGGLLACATDLGSG